jgi:hypothetical protein
LVAQRLVTVRTSSATLVTTPEHPFAKIGAGWTRAADLTRGDRVQTAGGGNATVVGVEIREAQPTAVYNLTVSKTHAYFVGSQAVLVHNADCGDPSSSGPNRARQGEEDPNERHEQSRARRAARIAHRRRQRELEQQRAYERQYEQRRMVENPFNDLPGQADCGYCVLAGLTDSNTVSSFILEHNLRPESPLLSLSQMLNAMRALGLTSGDTAAPRQFFPAAPDATIARVERDLSNGHPHPTFPFHEDAKRFMENSDAETFVVTLKYWDGSAFVAHAMLAGKRDDGSIFYLELQQVPPAVYDNIDPRSVGAVVVPTDVDWQSTWQLNYAVQYGVHQSMYVLVPP